MILPALTGSRTRRVEARAGQSLMQVAVDAKLDGLVVFVP